MKRVSAITVCTLAALTACSQNEPLGSNLTFDPPDQNPGDDLAEQVKDAPEASATVTQPEALGADHLSPKSSEQPSAQRDFAWRGLRPSLSANSERGGSAPHRSAQVPIRSERLSQIRAQVLANLNGQPSPPRLSPPATVTRQVQSQARPLLLSSTASQATATAQTAAPGSSQSTAASPQLISSLQASSGPEIESFSPRFSDSFQLQSDQSELGNPDLKLDEAVLFSDNAPQLIRASSATAAGESSNPERLIGRQSEATDFLSLSSSTTAAPMLISPSRTVDSSTAVASQGQSRPASANPANSQSSQQTLSPLQASSSAYVASVSEEILTNNQLDLTRFVFSDQFTLHGLPLHSPAFWLPETSSSVCFKTAPEPTTQPLALSRLQRLANKNRDSADCLGDNHYFAQMPKN